MKQIVIVNIIFLILLTNRSNQSEQQAYTYRLIGTSNSFAQYLPWYPCLNGSIIFEFKTHEPNGLLLYAQSPPYKYIQISLVDGNLRARMRIGEKDNPRGIFLVYQSVRLNDEKWHEIRFQRQDEKTILMIDGESLFHVHKDSSLNDLYFGDYQSGESHNLLFIGGIADSLQTYDLSLGTALFETRFNGFIRNVRALNCSLPFLIRLNPIIFGGLRFVAEQDSCSSNPCRNNGVCSIVTGSIINFKCDCTYTNYEGDLCEILIPPVSTDELTLTGKEYFSIEIPRIEKNSLSTILPTYEEEYNFDFKTSRSTGLLIYAGDSTDYFVLGLQDGGLFFKLNIKGQIFEKTLTIPGTYLHNNHWHSIKFTRRIRTIEIIIDNIKKDQNNLTGDFISMVTRFIYFGGVPKENRIYRTIHKNFIGCVRNVTYKSDVNSFNLISMVLNNSELVNTHGKLEKSCRKVMEPVTFSSSNSYIPILEWNDYPKLNSFKIEFQTTENHGVLAYILGKDNLNTHSDHFTKPIQSELLSFNRDFFSLEIHNRFLNAYFNLGTNYIRHEVVHEHVSNGKSHQITVELNDKYAIFKFDQKHETSIRIDLSESDRLELSGPLIIGGVHPNHSSSPFSNPSLRIPPYFYSGMLGNGYVGCIQDVEINGQSVNLTYYAALEQVSGINTETCTSMPNQCEIGHCLNEGICIEGWNRFSCDCSSTGFNGPICNQRKYSKNLVCKNADYNKDFLKFISN
ncbi:unnamed protein product [Brachionus calyciflorus]|uniref:Uncharacterized protein n=1 Tax=Brachionus calyciflorus TaxID=104777 RepID=A0A813WCJ8_9BILA|nr:unnamed protein product [Brachionus calyciflorus]